MVQEPVYINNYISAIQNHREYNISKKEDHHDNKKMFLNSRQNLINSAISQNKHEQAFVKS